MVPELEDLGPESGSMTLQEEPFHLLARIPCEEEGEIAVSYSHHCANLVRVVRGVNRRGVGPQEVEANSVEIHRASRAGGAPLRPVEVDGAEEVEVRLLAHHVSGFEDE